MEEIKTPGKILSESIHCWEDAGEWTSRSAIELGNIWKRLEAIRKAIYERGVLLNLPFLHFVQDPLEPFSSFCRAIAAMDHILFYLPGYFLQAEDGVFRKIMLESPLLSAPHVRENVSLRELSLCAASPDVNGEHGKFELDFCFDLSGNALFHLKQTAAVADGAREILTLTGDNFNLLEMQKRFPTSFFSKDWTLESSGDWIWNAYNILKRLSCPVRNIEIKIEPATQFSGEYKTLEIFVSEDGNQRTVLPETTAPLPADTIPEQEIWEQIPWRSPVVLFGGGKRIMEFCPENSPVPPPWGGNGPYTRTLLERHSYSAAFQNLSKSSLGPVTLNSIYRRCYRPVPGCTFLSGDGRIQNQWLEIVNGPAEYGRLFSYGDPLKTCPEGIGSALDYFRSFEADAVIPFNNPPPWEFI